MQSMVVAAVICGTLRKDMDAMPDTSLTESYSFQAAILSYHHGCSVSLV